MKILLVASEAKSQFLREQILHENPQAILTCVYSYKRALEKLSCEAYDKIVIQEAGNLSSSQQELEIQKMEQFGIPIVFVGNGDRIPKTIQDKHQVVGYDALIGALFQMRNPTSSSSREIVSLAKSQAQTEQEVKHLKEMVIELSQLVDSINTALYGTSQMPGITDVVRDLQKKYESSLTERDRKQEKSFHWRTTVISLAVTFVCTMIPLFFPQVLEQIKTEQKKQVN